MSVQQCGSNSRSSIIDVNPTMSYQVDSIVGFLMILLWLFMRTLLFDFREPVRNCFVHLRAEHVSITESTLEAIKL